MNPKFLQKTALDEYIKKLVKTHTVVGPTRTRGGTLYGQVKGADELALEQTNCLKGPKEYFFPQSEVLVEFEGYIDRAVPVGEPERPRPLVLFAARPCDVRSLEILDRLFINEDYVDDYYKARRQAATIFCLSCNLPKPSCFCTSVGGDPFGTAGCDVSMTACEEGFLLEPLTEKGESLVKDLEDAEPSVLKDKERLKEEAEKMLGPQLDIQGLPEKLGTMFDDPVWVEITDKCMGCGVCTYLCPTCHCFDIQDEAVDDRGKRVRNWDSCMFPIFTYHGSGHQPRDRRHQRMRQRIMHKFNYYVDNFDVIACVGCGRCVTECPTNEDLRDNLKRLKELESTTVE
jgi:ferredoxin